jgi:MFS family permease
MMVFGRTRENGRRDIDTRRAMRLANWNAALWAIGNGLISTLLVVYLATDLGATGVEVSLILAAPRFAGLFRLGVPQVMARVRARKLICIVSFIASAAILGIVPLAAVITDRIGNSLALSVFVVAWCSYHIAEYTGAVTLWSWLGDLTPRRIRGQMLGVRESWLTAGRVGGLVASASLAALWMWLLPEAPRWQPLALSALAGMAMILAAVLPLVLIPGLETSPSAVPGAPWRTIGRAFVDPAYRRLLFFMFWFSLANGISAVAQEMYPIRVLDITYYARQALQGMMRAGQVAVAPWAGRLTDRWGNRPILILSQSVVAVGILFFLVATKAHPWLIAGAFIVWIAYAGINVGLDNIKLKLAPPDNNAPFLAAFHAVGDIANGGTIVFGGWVLDHIRPQDPIAGPFYAQLFVLGFIARLMAIPLLTRLIEPGAHRLRDML